LKTTNRKFVNIKGDPFDIVGTVTVDLQLDKFSEMFQIIYILRELYILRESLISCDLILGRDFIGKEKIAITCDTVNAEVDQKKTDSNLFMNLPLYVEDHDSQLKKQLSIIEIDYDTEIRDYLTQLIIEIENTQFDVIDDDYSVKVHLRNDSVFAYVPKRFAHAERLQLRKITDDLMERGIIKNSISPYCSRVVLVKKKKRSATIMY